MDEKRKTRLFLLKWIRAAKRGDFSDARERNAEFNKLWAVAFNVAPDKIPNKKDEGWWYDKTRNAIINAWTAHNAGDMKTMKEDINEAIKRYEKIPT